MNRWLRLLRHRWLDETDVRRALDDAAMARLTERVQHSERRHRGEIRLCVEAGLPLSYLWRGASARERALAMFGKLRVWDTEHNNGVLIYLLLAEHAIEVVADRGLAQHVPAPQWQSLTQAMAAAFKAGRFEQGLVEAIGVVEQLLLLHFPLESDQANPNELADTPFVG